MNRLQACRVSAPLVLGAVWARWMLLGRDLHWMMRNEAGGRILPPQIPQKEPKIWRFPPITTKFGLIHVNIRALFKRPLIPRSRRVRGGEGGGDQGGGDVDHARHHVAGRGHGVGEAKGGVGGRGMACHARPRGEDAQ